MRFAIDVVSERQPLRTLIAQVSVVVALATTGSNAAEPLPTAGLYQIEVRIALPNVQDVAAPTVLNRCVSADDLKSGHAFFVRSDNPLRNCDLLDYQLTDGTASYRIACPGPNRGRAVAAFETTASTFRGSIKMNMGGKNMTMSETQIGKRIGNCP
jgi:hypothetical protein